MKHHIEIEEFQTSKGRMWFEAIVGTFMIFVILAALLLLLPNGKPVEDAYEGVPKPVIVAR